MTDEHSQKPYFYLKQANYEATLVPRTRQFFYRNCM
jgi:hypothetical protein